MTKKIIWGIWNLIQEVFNQIVDSSPSTELIFSAWALNNMRDWGIRRADVQDVFDKGQTSKKKSNIKYRKYGSYYICIKWEYDKSYAPIIKSVWKWDRK